ncbi:hypothetical protein [Sphingobacterium thalpophilum]|uniref:hypothetical protein n=1 Tax=Sphingobacterium thalpophilum TaxID=259 RepID=UPI0024A641AB|nr:hypothetical protein [Sphingobacterium thalpophilum]
MKNIVKYYLALTAFLYVLLTSCDNTRSDKLAVEQTFQQQAAPMVTKSYFLHHEIRDVDYKIFVNDVLIGQSHENRGIPGPYKLTPYLKPQDIQTVKIVLAANTIQPELTNAVLQEISKNAGVYMLQNDDYANITAVARFLFPSIKKPVTTYETQWEFNTGYKTSPRPPAD